MIQFFKLALFVFGALWIKSVRKSWFPCYDPMCLKCNQMLSTYSLNSAFKIPQDTIGEHNEPGKRL